LKKTFFLDTNIILDNIANIFEISNNGENIIVVCDVVLDELDSKKTDDNDVLKYQVREFFRFCEETKIISSETLDLKNNGLNYRCKVLKTIHPSGVVLHQVELMEYINNSYNTELKILKDRKIIETAKRISSLYDNFYVLSNDIAFRTRALLDDLSVQSFKSNQKNIQDLKFFMTFEYNINSETGTVCLNETSLNETGSETSSDTGSDTLNDIPVFDKELEFPLSLDDLSKWFNKEIPLSISGFEFKNSNGKKTYGYKDGGLIFEINDDFLKKQNILPINIKQKILSSICLSSYSDIVIVTGSAGCGKNVITTSAACALMDSKHSVFKKIVYIRNTIASVETKKEELGFLPGTLEEKMFHYMRPMYDTVEKLIKRKYNDKKLKNKEERELAITNFFKDYNIEFEYQGFLRGGTISDAIIICDEFQNMSVSAAKLFLTRIGENCKVFILGCNSQIDNPYVNKYNNGFTHLLNICNKPNNQDVRILGVELTETIRSKIAKFADMNL